MGRDSGSLGFCLPLPLAVYPMWGAGCTSLPRLKTQPAFGFPWALRHSLPVPMSTSTPCQGQGSRRVTAPGAGAGKFSLGWHCCELAPVPPQPLKLTLLLRGPLGVPLSALDSGRHFPSPQPLGV